MSSVLQSGRTGASESSAVAGMDNYSGTPEHCYTAGSEDFSQDPSSHSVGENSAAMTSRKQKRISESTAKYIEWPLEEV